MKRQVSQKKTKTLRPIRTNAGVHAWYRRQLDDAIEEMHNSIMYWVTAEYRKSGLAYDDNPAIMMRWALSKLSKRWRRRFDKMARRLATRFVDKSMRAGDASLRSAFKDMGLTVKLQMTDSMRTKYEAVISENVNLIKSIPEHHLTQVETHVMQSVARGRDLGTLTEALEKQFHVTHRRAALIARDQSNKASSILQAQRQRDLGITQGVWKHSHAGKEPRPEHVKADGETFDLDKGMEIEGEWIMPGEKINCRCGWKPIVPGFE